MLAWPRVLLLAGPALGRPADRGRLVLLLDRSARLRPRLLDRPGRCPARAAQRGHRASRRRADPRGERPADACGTAPMFVLGAGYDPIALTVDLADLPVAILVRIRGDRVFYTAAAARGAGQMGRPRRHGARFCCVDPTSWPAPEQTLDVDDEQYGRVQVAAWVGCIRSWPAA